MSGTAVLLIEVTDKAEPRCIRLAKSTGYPRLDSLALDAPQHFKYSAAEIDGQPADAIMRYTYIFAIPPRGD